MDMDIDMDTSIMELPEEVRGTIFNLIPQKYTVNLRLVCKTWNQEIQDNYEYTVKKLDEESPYFKSILQLRIKKLKIHRLETTPIFNPNMTSIFKRPNAVRILGIEKDSSVAQLNLQLLIGMFSENLQALVLNVTPKMCNYRFQFPADLSYNFKNLKTLSIKSKKFGEPNAEKCEDNPKSLFQVFENSSFPRLEKLDIHLLQLEMTLAAKRRIVENCLRITAKPGKSLKYLNLFINPKLLMTEPLELPENELARIKENDTLLGFGVGVGLGLAMKAFWTEIILKQKNLVDLHLTRFTPIHPISASLLEQILENNSNTLERFIFEVNISLIQPPFDLSVFRNCANLKMIKLALDPTINLAINEEPKIILFQNLPPKITTLEVKNLRISSEEMLVAFQSDTATGTQGFKNIQELRFLNIGNRGPFGINGVVLYEIMKTSRPTLAKVDFRLSVHKKEVSFKTVLSHLQINANEDFRLKRKVSKLCCKKWETYSRD